MTFVLELVPHCASVSRDGWVGSHESRPLSVPGFEQAAALVDSLGADVDAIYSSPALRCRQTVMPLAGAAGLDVVVVDALAEGFGEPSAWVNGVYAPMGEAVGGAWAAGRVARAVSDMATSHPGGRVVACSHGDVIPLFLALACAAYGAPLPEIVDRGGWYHLDLTVGTLTATARF